MGWIIAIFLTMGAVGSTTGGQSAYTVNSTFTCDYDNVYVPEDDKRTLRLGSFKCKADPTFTPGPTQESQPTPTIPVGTPTPAVLVDGIWTSAQDLATKSQFCPAWDVLEARANKSSTSPCIHDENDSTPNITLAKAIVFAKNGDPAYKAQVKDTLEKLVADGYTGCSADLSNKKILGWSRNLAGYIMSADLIGYHTPEFNEYITNVATVWNDPHPSGAGLFTMKELFETTPDYWSKWALASLASYYSYNEDYVALAELRQYFLDKTNGPLIPPKVVTYITNNALTDWYLDSTDPSTYQGIAPEYTRKNCWRDLDDLTNPDAVPVMYETILDGLQPSDMADGGECSYYPKGTENPWYGVEAMVVAGRIFERAGMPVWSNGNDAIYRAATALEFRLGSQVGGDIWSASIGSEEKAWMLNFIDTAYTLRSEKLATVIDDNSPAKWGGSAHSGGFGYVLPGVCE